FQSEFGQIMPARQRIFRPAWFFAADLDRAAIRQADVFGKMVEHDNAAKGRRQRGDEQAMIAPRDAAGDGARGVSTKAVREEPFAPEQLASFFPSDIRQFYSTDEMVHDAWARFARPCLLL